MIEDPPEPEEPVTPVPVDPEDSLPPDPDEEVTTEILAAARPEDEYPADETDEG